MTKEIAPNTIKVTAATQNKLPGKLKGLISNATMQELGLGKGDTSKQR